MAAIFSYLNGLIHLVAVRVTIVNFPIFTGRALRKYELMMASLIANNVLGQINPFSLLDNAHKTWLIFFERIKDET